MGRILLRAAEIRGALGEISGAHTTQLTALWLQTLVPLAQGDTVELRSTFRAERKKGMALIPARPGSAVRLYGTL